MPGALPHEIAAAICDQEPQRPSTAVSRVETGAHADARVNHSAESISAVREGTPERLRRRLRGDLDAIVLTALRKTPEHRYGSPAQLSEDIARHLDGRPIQARADSAAYRVRRLLWRHRLAFGAAAAVLLALVAGLVVATWQARVARVERARAEAGEARGRELLYAAHMNLAGQYWSASNVTRTTDLLNLHVPAAGGQDLRGFEWDPTCGGPLTPSCGRCPACRRSRSRRTAGTLVTADDAEKPSLQLWDLASGRRTAVLPGHEGVITAVDISADGTMLVSTSEDGTARLWRLSNDRPAVQLGVHAGPVLAATFDPAGRQGRHRRFGQCRDGVGSHWPVPRDPHRTHRTGDRCRVFA